jgi:hypothetical protein
VPDRRPVLENVTPVGKVDGVQPLDAVFEKVGAGLPDAVTWKVPCVPTEKLVELALVTPGLGLVGLLAPTPVETGPEDAWLVAPENWVSGELTQSVLTS